MSTKPPPTSKPPTMKPNGGPVGPARTPSTTSTMTTPPVTTTNIVGTTTTTVPIKPAAKPMMPVSKPGIGRAAPRAVKVFSVAPYSDANEGYRAVIYGKSGAGKTTLAAMAPNAIFAGIDDGGRKIRHPLTGEFLNAIEGLRDFYDLRDALHQDSLFTEGSTLVIDTITKVEEVAEPYLFANYQMKGKSVSSFRQYGWDGPGFMLDVMRLVLSDTDALIRRGVNVVFLAQLGQIKVANAEGADYLEDGPKLMHTKESSVRAAYCEAADYVLRLGYLDTTVAKDDPNAKVAKITATDATRAIFSGGAPHFIAKARPVKGNRLPPIISFQTEQDDSLWKFLSGEVVAE